MAASTIHGVRIAGLTSAAPAATCSLGEADGRFGAEDVRKISRSTGVETRHVSTGRLCSSDLCCAAARRLLKQLQWEANGIEAVVFVSQTPDYILPATSCTIQSRLGLSSDCAAFDVGMGCSGYVYGLWIAASLMAGSGLSRVLLLVGDTIPRLTSPQDRATTLLFGDAGTATALEKDAAAQPLVFSLGTDGTGARNLMIPAGMCRHPRDGSSAVRQQAEANNSRSAEDLFMDGAEIFAFTLREVTPLVTRLLAAAGWDASRPDYYVFHQANKFIINHLSKSLKLPPAKVPLSLQEFGNTSCASIPLTITTALASELSSPGL